MTTKDTYYKKEDDPNLTPAQSALDIFNDAKSKLRGVTIASENMDTIYTSLSVFYEHGSEQQQALITSAWQRITAIADELNAHANAVTGASNAITELEAERQKAKEALDELVKAIENVDYNNEYVQNLAEIIEENQMEYIDELQDQTMVDAISTVIEEYGGKAYSGRYYRMANTLIDTLCDAPDMPTEQKELLWLLIRATDGDHVDTFDAVKSNMGFLIEQLTGIEDDDNVIADKVIALVQNNTPMTDKQKEAYQAFLQTLIEG